VSIAPSIRARPRFAGRGAFSRDLDAAASAYFEGSGRTRRDAPRMYLKSAVMVAWFVGSWTLLVFAARTGLEGALAAISLGLSIAGIGMSVQHDGNHGASSKHAWVNRLFGCMLDVMGVCSFIWRQKHNICHHTFTNVQGIDYDLDFGVLARLSPEQRRRPWHRWQHLYLWFFYGFLLPKWVFHDDFVILRTRFIGQHALTPPSRAKLVAFIGWKVFFVMWAIAIPALFHPLWQVLVFHLVACFALGATLGTVFQLAHCTRNAEFPAVPPGERMEEWSAHQLATTVDFAKSSALVTWFVGGLNFQVEHHLFPKVSHVHYPALSRIVERLAAKHGLRYRSHTSLFAAVASHLSHLRELGRPVPGNERLIATAGDKAGHLTSL
jgi:linoleoyl-CoA desaturase